MHLWPQKVYLFSLAIILGAVGAFNLVYISLWVFTVVCLLYALRIEPLPAEAVRWVVDPSCPLTIAHRGGSEDAPENTIPAFIQAKAHGADAVEFDLEFTKDKVPVLLHDDTVDRTSDGVGKVSEFTLEQLKTFNFAAKHPQGSKFGIVSIPTLEEAVNICLKLNLKMFIDCKQDADETTKVLSSMFSNLPELYKKAVVCSFYPHIIYKIRRADPKIITALTHRHQFISLQELDGEERFDILWQQIAARFGDIVLEWAHYVILWYLCGHSLFVMNNKSFSSIHLGFWKKRGVEVVVWTVNDPLEKNYFLKNHKCSIMSDITRPDRE